MYTHPLLILMPIFHQQKVDNNLFYSYHTSSVIPVSGVDTIIMIFML